MTGSRLLFSGNMLELGTSPASQGADFERNIRHPWFFFPSCSSVEISSNPPNLVLNGPHLKTQCSLGFKPLLLSKGVNPQTTLTHPTLIPPNNPKPTPNRCFRTTCNILEFPGSCSFPYNWGRTFFCGTLQGFAPRNCHPCKRAHKIARRLEARIYEGRVGESCCFRT